jgi:hypothetical protein
MKDRLSQIAQRTDAFCARLNDGLAAVAIVLALLTTAALVQRLPLLLPLGTDPVPASEAPAGNW